MRRVAVAGAVIVFLVALVALASSRLLTDSVPNPGASGPERIREERLADQERRREAKFDAPLSACRDFGQGRGPQLCLERVSRESGPFGRTVDLRLRWRNLSPGQRIRVRVTSAAPVGSRYRYLGPSGAITERLFGATPEGDELIRWDGKRVYCAPTDAPMMCDAGEVGRFRLEALLFTGDDPFWPSFPPREPVPATMLLRSEAPEVEFTGLPRPLSHSRHASIQMLSQTLRQAFPSELSGVVPQPWDLLEQERPFYSTASSYCSDLPLEPPLAGKLRLCFPKSVRDEYGLAVGPDDVTVRGRPRIARGVLHPEQAKTIAERAAIRAFEGRYDFDHYPSDEELERFGRRPERGDNWTNAEAVEAAQQAWDSRIVYLKQEQTTARYIGEGQWLVSVDQVAMDKGQEPRSDFLVRYYRIGPDKRPCLIAVWNRTKETGGPPRQEQERTLPCLS